MEKEINFYYSDDKNHFEIPSGCAVRSLLSVHSAAGKNKIFPKKKRKNLAHFSQISPFSIFEMVVFALPYSLSSTFF
jgi:hypothetical protein